MKQLVAIICVISAFFSCSSKQNSCGQAFIGGEIINPNNDYLVLYDDSSPIDTLYLDENNRFSHKIESLNSGLHSFIHGGEYQVVVIEPNDSIMIRLNTLDFDESLVFSGKGSKKNNFLIDLFVKLEKEDKYMYEFSKLPPIEFQEKIDSLKKGKIKNLKKFTEKYPSSDLFSKVANASINYSYFTHKELYPFRFYGNNNLVNRKNLPKDFYNYRKHIDYNDQDLKDFYPYYNFLFPHINNLALDKYFEKTKDTVFNVNSIHYNLNKLELMDSLVYSDAIKNNLLKYATRNFLSHSNSINECEKMYQSYINKSTSKEDSNYITSLFETSKRLQPGNRLPDVEIINSKNETININAIIEKPTVVYFWSNASKYHFKNSHKKVKALKREFPDIDFVSVNINANNASVWKRILKQNKFGVEDEYRFRNPHFAKKQLAINYIRKVLVIDKNSKIISSNSDLFDSEFKYILNKLK
jgi:hypothetical protein